MPAAQDGPPCAGSLRVLVHRAYGLRRDVNGGLPDPQIRLRILTNPKSSDNPKVETDRKMQTVDPDFNQEVMLKVRDANSSQLEVTIWDSKEQRSSSGFMGECILNLSKLVPFQGHIIEQDFEVKPGKQYKTKVPASGKLILQLEFNTDPNPPASTSASSPPPQAAIAQPSTVAPSPNIPAPQMPQQPSPPSPHNATALVGAPASPGSSAAAVAGMSVTVVEGKDVVREADGSLCTDPYACVSLITDPQMLQHQHYLMLDHFVPSAIVPAEPSLRFPPQHCTHRARAEPHPKWDAGATLQQSHPAIAHIEALQGTHSLENSTHRVPLEGQVVLMLITVHDAVAPGRDAFAGRVLIPQVLTGQQVDQWFMLQRKDGSQLVGPTGEPSSVRIRLNYSPNVSLLSPPLPLPTPQHPPLPAAPAPQSASRPVSPPGSAVPQHPTASTTPRSPTPIQATTATAAAAPSPKQPGSPVGAAPAAGFAFALEVVEARNLSRMDGTQVSETFAAVSLMSEPALMETDNFLRIEHGIGFTLDPNHLRIRPLHTTHTVRGASDPIWTDSCKLTSTHPNILEVQRVHQSGGNEALGALKDRVPLTGEDCLMMVTVHDVGEGPGDDFCGRVIIPHIGVSSPVDQWLMLQDRDGTQLKGPNGLPSGIRLRLAYRPASATEDVTLPLPDGWEKKVDPQGRTFFVNHQLKTFSWSPPPLAAPVSPPPAAAAAPPPAPADGAASASMTGSEPQMAAPSVSAPPRSNAPPAPAQDALPPSSPPRPSPQIGPSPREAGDSSLRARSPRDAPPRSVSPRDATLRSSPRQEGHVPVRPEVSDISIQPPPPGADQARVIVRVIGARGLPGDSPPPSIRIFLEATGIPPSMGRTATYQGAGNPVWGENFVFGIDAGRVAGGELKIVATSAADVNGEWETIGQVRRLPLRELAGSESLEGWFDLISPKHGRAMQVADGTVCGLKLEMSLMYPHGAPPSGATHGVDAAHRHEQEDPSNSLSDFLPAPAPTSTSPRPPADGAPAQGGIGMVVILGEGGRLRVQLLATGGPAAASGRIAPGDTLLEVNGRSVENVSLPEVQRLLRGEPSSPVSVTILHTEYPGDTPRREVVSLIRKKLDTTSSSQPSSSTRGTPPPTQSNSPRPPYSPPRLSPRAQNASAAPRFASLRGEYSRLIGELLGEVRDAKMDAANEWKSDMLFRGPAYHAVNPGSDGPGGRRSIGDGDFNVGFF